MTHLESLRRKVQAESSVFIAPSAEVMGRVTLERQVSIWFGAVLRADHDTIFIGAETNVQDGAILHVDEGYPIVIGKGNTIGHAAIVHGATIADHTLIGMRATVMNGAKIGNECLIGAHALVTEGMEIPDRSLVLGAPAKIVGQVTDAHLKRMALGVSIYVNEAARHLAE